MNTDPSRLCESSFAPVIGAQGGLEGSGSHTAQKVLESLQRARLAYNDEVARRAYYLAERRHFAAGHELEDWLMAEALVRDNCRRHGEP